MGVASTSSEQARAALGFTVTQLLRRHDVCTRLEIAEQCRLGLVR